MSVMAALSAAASLGKGKTLKLTVVFRTASVALPTNLQAGVYEEIMQPRLSAQVVEPFVVSPTRKRGAPSLARRANEPFAILRRRAVLPTELFFPPS